MRSPEDKRNLARAVLAFAAAIDEAPAVSACAEGA
jgi:hypothetical protein